MRLTISKYYVPSGDSISNVGVSPDILVEEQDNDFKINTDSDNQLNYAIKLLTMWMDRNKLPLRLGVGAIVLNKDNKVFVGKRKDNPIDKWQMPQGGVDNNEDLVDAMKRELEEETSIKNIKIIKELEKWTEYELPDYLLGKIWKGKFRGQKQKWFIVRFLGNDDEINLKTDHPEFIEWKWLNIEKLPDVIVHFKKSVYEKLVPEIKSSIN